jgi:hypothetical protein
LRNLSLFEVVQFIVTRALKKDVICASAAMLFVGRRKARNQAAQRWLAQPVRQAAPQDALPPPAPYARDNDDNTVTARGGSSDKTFQCSSTRRLGVAVQVKAGADLQFAASHPFLIAPMRWGRFLFLRNRTLRERRRRPSSRR